MSVHSSQKKRRKDGYRMRSQALGNHEKFEERMMKTLYYGKMPALERFSLPVTELAVELYTEATARKTLERLRLDRASEISRNACMSPCSFVLAILYLERLKTLNPSYLEKVSPSELFLISMASFSDILNKLLIQKENYGRLMVDHLDAFQMVATKFLNDSGEEDDVLNSEWACSIGLPLKTINSLEKEFLDAIDWKVFIDSDDFWSKFGQLERTVAAREGNKRGWFSYSDLEVLLDYVNCMALAQSVVTVSAVCLASYITGMLTVIGSTIVATHVATTCSNLYRPPPATVLHTEPTPAQLYGSSRLTVNGTSEDCLNNFQEDSYSDFIDWDAILESQENSSQPDHIYPDFQAFRSPFGVTSPGNQLTNFMAPLIKHLNLIPPGSLIPNR